MKNLTRLGIMIAIVVIHEVLQRHHANRILKREGRGWEVLKSWLNDEKITLTMLNEYFDAVNDGTQIETELL